MRQAGNVVATTAATSYTVTGLTPNTAYSFTVTAQDAASNTSPPSNTVTVTTNTAPNSNLALDKPTAESSHVQSYVSGNAVDGDPNSYWESANNAFPQWLQVDLGAATSVSRIVLKLPPPSAWAHPDPDVVRAGQHRRLSFSTWWVRRAMSFNPASGNTVTITFPATSDALPAVEHHRQHGLAGRPGLRVRGLRLLTRSPPEPASGAGGGPRPPGAR